MNKKKLNSDQETFLADWLAGIISDEELKQQVSEEDYVIYKKIKSTSESLEMPKFDALSSYDRIKHKNFVSNTKVRNLIPDWIYTVAALFVLLFGVYRFFDAETKFTTDFSQTKQIALNEGTQVFLNAKSTLQFPKYQQQRKVSLKGEAFFEVTKKGDFKVQTPMGEIAVLGTKFNVIATNDVFEVICYEGKVKVTYKGISKVLYPSDACRVLEGKMPETWKTSQNKALWLSGETDFRSMPVKYVIKSLEKQFHITIQNEAAIDTIKFTGSYPNDNMQKALKSLCLPLNLHFEIKENQTVILSKK